MKVDKISISLDPGLGDELRAAARRAGQPVSNWLADAAAARLRRDAFREFIAQWEAEHGAFTESEMARARADLGLPNPQAPAGE